MTSPPDRDAERVIQAAIEALALGYPVAGTPNEKRTYVDQLAAAIEACARDVQRKYFSR